MKPPTKHIEIQSQNLRRLAHALSARKLKGELPKGLGNSRSTHARPSPLLKAAEGLEKIVMT